MFDESYFFHEDPDAYDFKEIVLNSILRSCINLKKISLFISNIYSINVEKAMKGIESLKLEEIIV